jgi:hypothetical protein
MSIETNGNIYPITNWDCIPLDVQRRIATVGYGVGITAVGYAGETEVVERPASVEVSRIGDFRVPLVGEFYD